MTWRENNIVTWQNILLLNKKKSMKNKISFNIDKVTLVIDFNMKKVYNLMKWNVDIWSLSFFLIGTIVKIVYIMASHDPVCQQSVTGVWKLWIFC